ncbi:hypothetical protein F4774DRAFT_408193 [Daldinia eschscholtzii]|nr:hypothetical protein F4774DRAFT_408193 [Daldinia eschscholtzii]
MDARYLIIATVYSGGSWHVAVVLSAGEQLLGFGMKIFGFVVKEFSPASN